jgi:single-strand DNA-binding protein
MCEQSYSCRVSGRHARTEIHDARKAVASFSLAVNQRWKDSEGTAQEAVQWFRVVSFGRLAEVCAEFLTKGRHVFVEGRVQVRTWEDRNAEKHTAVEVVAQEIRILDPMNRNESGNPAVAEAQNTDTAEVPF